MTTPGGNGFPAGTYTTAVGNAPYIDSEIPFSALTPQLQGSGTTVIYIDPGVNLHNIAGPNAGLEGTRLAQQVAGDQQWPFDQVLTRSPYVMGADINRQNYPERNFHIGIVIGSHNPPMTEYQYRMAEDYWWNGQDETNDGWLGVFTRYSGWRWIPVRPGETVASPQPMDSTAYGNNASRWDLVWLASRPYFTKPALYGTFQSNLANYPPKPPPNTDTVTGTIDPLTGGAFYWGNIPVANRGDLPSYVTFLVSSPGQAIVQDNTSTRLVVLPYTQASVGTYMCDSEPTNRTLTAANDPQDNLAFDLIRQSTILNFFLSGIANEGLPLQLTFQGKFIYSIPPHTETTFTVGHSNPGGTITAIVPQRFKRSR